MRVIYSAETRRANIALCRRVLDRFERDDQLLAARANATMPDGYPPNSMPGPGQRGGTSDRVGTAVSIRTNALADDAATRAYGLLYQAAKLLEIADSERARALPPATTKTSTDDVFCTSCARIQRMEPRADPERLTKEFGAAVATRAGDEGWCRWCAAWWAEHAALPPTSLLEKRAIGKRITTQDVAIALRTLDQ